MPYVERLNTEELLDNVPQEANRGPHRRQGVSHAKPINAAKEKIPTIDLADLLCGPGGMRRMGARWVARCPLPGHDEHTPSFTVFPEQNSWYCFGACQRGGDVVHLAAAAWGYGDGEMAAAAANLLHEFGHPIPERPTSWGRKQARQKPVRDELDRIKTNSLRRRLFRILEPTVAGIADDEERAAEAEHLWRELTPLAARMVLDRGVGE